MTMKVAIATNGSEVSPHFGRCESYEIAEVADGKVVSRQTVPNPGHEHGSCTPPEMLHERGVGCVVCGGAGPRAAALFEQIGIRLLTGASGPVSEVLRALASGEFRGGESTCGQGEGSCHSPD